MKDIPQVVSRKSNKEFTIKGIVLDLRSNPGGLLDQAVEISSIFLKDGVVVSTEARDPNNKEVRYVKKTGFKDVKTPIIVLVNGASASASEIVSGSLQDLDRAVVVGSRSFGKGLVQRPKPLTYGTQLKVTISRYYTPSGRCIQALDYWNRDDKGNAVRVKQENYNAFKTKNGRPVFDGGGVVPDLELSETKVSKLTKHIVEQDYIFNYATKYYYNNSVSDLMSFKLSDADFNGFNSYLKSNNFAYKTKTEEALEKVLGVAKDEELDDDLKTSYSAIISKLNTIKRDAITTNKTQLKTLLENEIIKRYFYREGLYEYFLANNNEVKTATQILKNPNTYNDFLKR